MRLQKVGGEIPLGAFQRSVFASCARALGSSSKDHNSDPSRKCVNALRSPFGFASLALSVPTAVVFLTLPRASLPVSVTTEGGVASARGSPRASVSAEGHFHISAASSSIIRSEKGSSSL